MRRLVVTCAVLLGLALPAAAGAGARTSAADGTFVLQNGDNGDGVVSGARPVVTLVVTGFVIGKVSDQGTIRIFDIDPSDQTTPEVTGTGVTSKAVTYNQSVDGTQWTGSAFRFRAVGGTFRVVIWGSGVYVFAGGHGKIWMSGNPSDPGHDGIYSFDGDPFVSLPGPGPQPYQLGS